MTRESIVSSYNTEDALGDKPLELVRPTNHVHELNTIHHQILEVKLYLYLFEFKSSRVILNFIIIKLNFA